MTVFPVIRVPMFFAEFHQGKYCGSFFKKHNFDEQVQLLDNTVVSALVCTSPLAVTTVVGLLDVLMASNSAGLRSFSQTICILAPESTTNSLSSGSLAEALGSTHSSVGEKNVALSFALSLHIYMAISQALLWTHRSCLSVSSWDRPSNLMAWGLRCCRGLTCTFPSDGPFLSLILASRSVDFVNRTL